MPAEARTLQLEDRRGTIADQSYVGALIQKWGEFLEGIPARTEADRYVLGCTAVLMESEARHLRDLTEETRTANVGSFTKFIFPVLRRVFPNLIANEIVSVQPMTSPVGAIFYLDYIYRSTKGPVTDGDRFPQDFDRDYSSEYVNGEVLATGNGAAFGGVGTALSANLAWTPARPLDASRGYSVVIREINATTGETEQEATDNGSGGFTGDVSAGTVNYSNGAISGFLFTNAPANNNQIKAYYYFDGELNTKQPEVSLDVKKSAIEAKARRLKSLWSSEAAEDLKNLHGIDVESELVAMVAQEMALEIDREIINDLFLGSTGTTATFDRVPPSGISEVDHLRSMVTPIATVSNIIHRKTLRAPANWIVTSPEVSALFMQLTTHGDYTSVPGGMVGDMRPMSNHGQFSVYRVGSLKGRWTVYEDPYFTRDQMLIGLKGNSFLDAGYVWAPYIPLQITQSFIDPSDFSIRKGMRTRYAKKMVRPDYYGQLRVVNL